MERLKSPAPFFATTCFVLTRRENMAFAKSRQGRFFWLKWRGKMPAESTGCFPDGNRDFGAKSGPSACAAVLAARAFGRLPQTVACSIIWVPPNQRRSHKCSGQAVSGEDRCAAARAVFRTASQESGRIRASRSTRGTARAGTQRAPVSTEGGSSEDCGVGNG